MAHVTEGKSVIYTAGCDTVGTVLLAVLLHRETYWQMSHASCRTLVGMIFR